MCSCKKLRDIIKKIKNHGKKEHKCKKKYDDFKCDNFKHKEDYSCEYECDCHHHKYDYCYICPEGPQGPPGEPGECCCSDAIKYALDTICDSYCIDSCSYCIDSCNILDQDPSDSSQYVTLYYLNQSKTGVIAGYSTNGKVVHLKQQSGEGNTTDNYVSLCNVMYVSFSIYPEILENINCDTPECCCNQDVEEILRQLIPYPIGKNSPVDTNLSINLNENNDSAFNIKTVYGICNGILWAEVEDGSLGGDDFIAIPLCAIYNMYNRE